MFKTPNTVCKNFCLALSFEYYSVIITVGENLKVK